MSRLSILVRDRAPFHVNVLHDTTVRQLKEAVAKILERSVDAFKLSFCDQVLCNDSYALKAIGIIDTCMIIVTLPQISRVGSDPEFAIRNISRSPDAMAELSEVEPLPIPDEWLL